MSAFTDALKADADAIFLNTDEFAESITYTPAGGSPVTINALITKNQLARDGATPRQLATEISVQLSRADVPVKPVLGGAKVQISGIAQALFVCGIVDESDPAMWHVLVK